VTEALEWLLDFAANFVMRNDYAEFVQRVATLRTTLDHAAEVQSTVDIAIARVQRDEVRIADLQARLDALYGEVICTEGTYDAHASECLTCEQQAVCAALEAAKGEK
jgi:hypothetical protein